MALDLAGGLLRSGWSTPEVELFVEASAQAAGDGEVSDRVGAVNGTQAKLQRGENTTGWPKVARLLGEHGEALVAKVRQWLGLVTPPRGATSSSTSGVRYRPLPPYQPFPVNALPPVARDLVEDVARSIGCDPALVALPVLAATAGAIGNSRAVQLKRKWIEPCCLWTATVADSGACKSPAFAEAIDPLVHLQMDVHDAHREQVEAYKKDLERGEESQPPEDPLVFVTSDATIEALGELLRNAPRGILVARDELDGWLASFTRYKGRSSGSDRPAWLELHRAGTLLIERLTREQGRVAVRRPLVSVTGTIQPGTLARALDQDALQAGLGARLLLAMPPRHKRTWRDDADPSAAALAYPRLLGDLLALDLADATKRTPHVLNLSEPARKRWIAFYSAWGEVQHQAEGEQAAAFAKIEGYAARLIRWHHVVTHPACGQDDRCPIAEASAQAGIEMARWFAAEATRIYRMLREDDEARDCRRLVEFVQHRGGRISVKELQRANGRKHPTRAEANAALEGLVQAGLGYWEERTRTPKGGRPTQTFVLEIVSDETDETSPEGLRCRRNRPPGVRRNLRRNLGDPHFFTTTRSEARPVKGCT